MEERRKDQETRNDEVRPCATPSDQGFDQCGKSKTSECASSRERSLKKAPSDATRRSFWTGYTPRPGHGNYGGDAKEKGDDKSSSTRKSIHESI